MIGWERQLNLVMLYL